MLACTMALAVGCTTTSASNGPGPEVGPMDAAETAVPVVGEGGASANAESGAPLDPSIDAADTAAPTFDSDGGPPGDADAAVVPEGGPGVHPGDAADATISGSDGGDEIAPRPLMVDKTNPQLYTIRFKPSDADPTVSTNDAEQTAYFDTRVAQIRGKLVVTLSGTGNPPGPLGLTSYAASLGFHSFAVAYHNGWDPSSQSNPDFFGQGRFDEFDGMGRQKSFTVPRSESVEVRVSKALAYLQSKNAQGDWGYYLDNSGQVRWSDVIFFGQSHGATSAAAYAKLRRVSRAVSMSGPRDTNPVVAAWLTLPSPTPIDRYYGFTGTQDSQHPDHLKAMQVMGYLGQVVDITQAMPPYADSHRLQYDGAHTDDLTCMPFPVACQYLLGTLGP
jgi:hypothetical protein